MRTTTCMLLAALGSLALAGRADAATFTVTNTNDSGAGSLRAAILGANGTPGPDAIGFNIPGPGPYVIGLVSPLPVITDPVTLDATTQPGWAGKPIIQLDGAAAGVGADGLDVSAGGTTLRGLVVRRFDGNGIRLRASGGDVVQGCYVGTDVTGSVAQPNNRDGIRIEDAALNTIGGAAAGAGNLVSANLAHGVEIDAGPGFAATFNSTDVPKSILDFTTTSSMLNSTLVGAVIDVEVTVNIRHTYDADLRLALIGPDATRVDLSLNNGGSGDNYQNTVFDDSGTVPITAGSAPFASPPSYIPQAPLSAFNGRQAAGPWMLEVMDTASGDVGQIVAWSIHLTTAPSFSNQILGNRIGTDAGGANPLGNQMDGIRIVNSPGNQVGSAAPGARNVVSGNVVYGIETLLPGAVKNVIQGNYVGTDTSGNIALPQTEGIFLRSNQNLVGGTGAGEGNVVSGNGSTSFEAGVHITGDNNLVQGNKLGTNAAGTAGVPNAFAGVEAEGSFNTIGGGVAGAGNLISGNTYLGVVLGVGGGNNTVQGNLIGTNLAGTAALPNGTTGINVLDSGNNQIGGSTPAERNIISGNLTSGVSLTRLSSIVGGNHVEGNYVGTDVTGTVAIGNALYGISISTAANVIGGPVGSGRGNLISGNGSYGVTSYGNAQSNQILGNIIGLDRLADNPIPNGGAGVELSGYADTIGGSGPGEGNVISANIGPGVWVQELPGAPTTTTTYVSTDVPKAIPDLSFATSVISVPDNSIIIDVDVKVNITHTFDADLFVWLRAPDGTPVPLSRHRGGSGDNFTGTIFDDEGSLSIAAGSAPFSSPPSYTPEEPLAAFDGLPAAGTWTLNVNDEAAGDSGTLNSWSITVTTAYIGASANQILGNMIGTDGTGTKPRGNQGPGVRIDNAAGNQIGDFTAGAGNLISANQQGIELTGSETVGNAAEGNLIGTQIDGVSPLGNLSDGVLVEDDAFGNRIGKTTGVGSTIAFNGGSGVHAVSGRNNKIWGNSIHSNAGLGIDLDPAGVTVNDPGDGDAGPNGLQNYPVVTATPSGGGTLLTYQLNSLPNRTYTLQFYENSAPDPSGHGEGKNVFAIAFGAVTDSAGNYSGTWLVGGSHSFVTATATDSANNTSEFSEVVKTVLEASPAKDMKVKLAGPLLEVTYTPACGATDHAIYWGMAGPFAIGPAGLNWINAACGMGVSGTAFFDPGTPEPGMVFYFIIAGQNGSVEGSYGQASNGVEEPEANLPVVCNLPQYLGGICY